MNNNLSQKMKLQKMNFNIPIMKSIYIRLIILQNQMKKVKVYSIVHRSHCQNHYINFPKTLIANRIKHK